METLKKRKLLQEVRHHELKAEFFEVIGKIYLEVRIWHKDNYLFSKYLLPAYAVVKTQDLLKATWSVMIRARKGEGA